MLCCFQRPSTYKQPGVPPGPERSFAHVHPRIRRIFKAFGGGPPLPLLDLEDAYALGTRLREAGTREPEPIAVRIVLDDLIVYQTFLPGTGKDNNWWMDKKYATVKRTHHSSLLAAAERELASSREDWQCDEEHYAFCGGGSAIVSGLPHLDDHRCLTETIAAYLGKTI